jgi:RNA polymerase sigma-70 factor (ECF subfamily)
MNSAVAPTAFRDIADELAQPLLRYLERYVGDRAVAEDLSQETLLRMHQGLAAFAGRSSLKTWAFAIANRVGDVPNSVAGLSRWS